MPPRSSPRWKRSRTQTFLQPHNRAYLSTGLHYTAPEWPGLTLRLNLNPGLDPGLSPVTARSSVRRRGTSSKHGATYLAPSLSLAISLPA